MRYKTGLSPRRSLWVRLFLCALGAILPNAAGADRPQWGEYGTHNMTSQEKGLVESFDPATGKNVKWVARLGTETYATPVVAGGRVYLGTNNGAPRDPRRQGDRGILLCLGEKNGQLLWQLAVPKLTTSIYWDWPNAGICSPATVEGNRVYLVSNRGEVLCLDPPGMADGNGGPFREEGRHAAPEGAPPVEPSERDADILWLFDMVKELGVRQHDSAHGSILAYGSRLYVNTSNGVDDSHRRIASPEAPSLAVLDRETGRLVARDAERIGPRIFHSTWSSPGLAMVQGNPLVFFAGGDGIVYAFQPAAPGKPPGGTPSSLTKVWQFDGDPASPKTEVHRFIGNRKESPSNIKSMPVFHKGRLYVTLGGDQWWGKNQAWLQCIEPPSGGSGGTAKEVFSYPLERHSMCTPAIYNDLVFVGDSGRRIHCLDAATGKPYWTHDVRGEIWASPLGTDEKVYFATRQGEFLVFAASREKRLIGQTDLGGPVNSTPVAANGVLYVATATHLYALQKKAP